MATFQLNSDAFDVAAAQTAAHSQWTRRDYEQSILNFGEPSEEAADGAAVARENEAKSTAAVLRLFTAMVADAQQTFRTNGLKWTFCGRRYVQGNFRCVYKCAVEGCPASKTCLVSATDGTVHSVSLRGEHNHPTEEEAVDIPETLFDGSESEDAKEGMPPLKQGRLDADLLQTTPARTDIQRPAPASAPQISQYPPVPVPPVQIVQQHIITEPDLHGRSADGSVPTRRVVVAAIVDGVVPHQEDGYKWRKYGRKKLKGLAQPRMYYRCNVAGCPAKRQVDAAGDKVYFTYEGTHTHPPAYPALAARFAAPQMAPPQNPM